MNSISANLNMMIKATEKASKVIIRDFGELENLQVSKKGPRDFVTNADKKVEKILINELCKKKYSIISEERGKIVRENRSNFWVIDPIDGTTNFLHGIPHFCISVAHISNGEVISGVIYDPIKNEIFYGEKNSGAFYNGTDATSGAWHEVNSSIGNEQIFAITCHNTGTDNEGFVVRHVSNTNNTSSGFISCANDVNGTKFAVKGNGNVQSATNSYGSTSDERLKSDIKVGYSEYSAFLRYPCHLKHSSTQSHNRRKIARYSMGHCCSHTYKIGYSWLLHGLVVFN